MSKRDRKIGENAQLFFVLAGMGYASGFAWVVHRLMFPQLFFPGRAFFLFAICGGAVLFLSFSGARTIPPSWRSALLVLPLGFLSGSCSWLTMPMLKGRESSEIFPFIFTYPEFLIIYTGIAISGAVFGVIYERSRKRDRRTL